MTSESFAQEWPGASWPRKGHHHHHRHGGAQWRYARGERRHGRPTPEDLERLEAAMELRHLRGVFGGPGPFGRGPRGRGRGRARRGDVRLALLRLLAEEPRNGYQLMQAIEERSGGRWRPSPGSVYPTLAQLEDEGLIRSGEAGGSRQFEITPAGREHLEERAGDAAPWQPAEDEGENPLAELGPLVIQIGKAVWQVATVGDQAQRERARALLAETRRGLYRILAEDADHGEGKGSREPADAGEQEDDPEIV